MASSASILTVGVGDIHGRFLRVHEWLAALEAALGRRADLVLAVGDAEAFVTEGDHRRKAVKRQLPAEYAAFASGERALHPAMYFVAGNNEDFETLHRMPSGGELPGGLHYLGRAGKTRLAGLSVAYLSGIWAPKHFELPPAEPKTALTRKQAGYFRQAEVLSLQGAQDVDLFLLHEWPKRLLARRAGAPPLKAHRFPWIGNPVARALIDSVRPKWAWCGHSHVPYAATVRHPDGSETRVACLDQAARPEDSIFWLEWDGREPVRGGWGLTGEAAWRAGEPWDESRVPD